MTAKKMPSGRMSAEDSGKGAQAPETSQSMPKPTMGGEALGGMPSGSMEPQADQAPGSMRPKGDQASGSPRANDRVLLELRVPRGERSLAVANAFSVPGVSIDPTFDPIPMKPTLIGNDSGRAAADADEETVVVRATVDPSRIAELEANPTVVKVWKDGPIAPFHAKDVAGGVLDAPHAKEAPAFEVVEGMATCPIGTCDCAPGTAKGTLADVAAYLGVNQIWTNGPKGDGMVVGVVDGGIRADGRPTSEGGPKLARVIGGWPTASWGRLQPLGAITA